MTFPYLSLGCHNLTGGSSSWRSERLVHCALDFGIRRFDVAPCYGLGTAEKVLGKALGKMRSDPSIEITTKFGLEPAPLGAFKALMREPVRFIRHFVPVRASIGRGVVVTNPSTSAGSRVDPLQSLERSLRALGVDRLGCLLTHEAIHPDYLTDTVETLGRLCREGVIGKFGYSGARQAVQELLSVDTIAIGEPVVQVSIDDVSEIGTQQKLRIFNMSVMASRIFGTAALRDSLFECLELSSFAAALAASLSFSRQNWDDAVVLVNASSDKRLAEVLSTLSDRRLSEWTDENMTTLRALAKGGL
ncbi:hypothetical protein GVM20_00415 [Porphyrobacter sp. SLTP]|uniref:aldo/keto reductase n=1 Tax=Porphyrobacter sp. SLTP TaxID=2683266 RepID=UPI0014122B81|nr:aldo/keto reductase [Porphyrobacter sp. SLTP]NBB23585.1 hypothetical protein [Porphyrobacter sp. SLTP]